MWPLSLYNDAQLLLACGVLVYAWSRGRALSRQRVDDAARRVSSLLRAHERGDVAGVDRALDELGQRWLGRVCRAVLRPQADGNSVDELLLGQRYEASRGALALRLAMTLGSVSGLAGALYQIALLPSARRSLLGLVPGLAERRAFEAGMLSAGLGIAVALIAGLSLRRIRRLGSERYRECVEAANRLEDALLVAEAGRDDANSASDASG